MLVIFCAIFEFAPQNEPVTLTPQVSLIGDKIYISVKEA